jgi:hypothetical protein
MKKRTLNLLIASLIYVVAFIAIVVVSWGIVGLAFTDDYGDVNPDALIFLGSVFFAFLSSFAVYLIFTLVEWHKADTEHNLKFLGLGPRILNAFIATVISSVLLLVCVYFWISDAGEEISILQGNLSIAAVVLVLITAIDFVSFLKFKPRP